jgi:PST family polysaccharide transporter
MKHIFAQLRQLADYSSDLGRVLRNVSWASGERALRLLIGLAVTSVLARYLGAQNFGLLSLGLAIVAILMPFTELGLQGIIIKAHVQEPEHSDLITGTSLVLRLIGSTITVFLAVGIAKIFSDEDTKLVPIVTVLSLTALFRCTDTFKHIFESRVYSKPIIIAEFCSSILANVFKLVAVASGATLLTFAAIQSLEAMLAAVAVIAVYRKYIGRLSKMRVSFSKAVELLRNGWPLMLSTLAVLIYMKIDQIMLGAMIGETDVGIYAIAARISEVWYFIPGVMVWSTFPFLVEAKKENTEFYIRRLIRLFRSVTLLAVCAAVAINLFGSSMIHLLFGEQFSRASSVLTIHAWGGVFAVLSIVTRYWSINENLQHLEMIRTVSGAIINILLNLLLIPKYGIIGAAYATLLSHLWAGFLFDFTHPATRRLLYYKIQAAIVWRKI